MSPIVLGAAWPRHWLLVHAHDGTLGILGFFIRFEHLLHAGDELAVGVGRNWNWWMILFRRLCGAKGRPHHNPKRQRGPIDVITYIPADR